VCNNAEWHNGRRQLILYILLISEVAIFTYEMKHLDPLTQTLSLSIQLDSFFSHTLHRKCSDVQPTFHDFLWFLILNHPLLSSSGPRMPENFPCTIIKTEQ
jgi:hypothetical protein